VASSLLSMTRRIPAINHYVLIAGVVTERYRIVFCREPIRRSSSYLRSRYSMSLLARYEGGWEGSPRSRGLEWDQIRDPRGRWQIDSRRRVGAWRTETCSLQSSAGTKSSMHLLRRSQKRLIGDLNLENCLFHLPPLGPAISDYILGNIPFRDQSTVTPKLNIKVECQRTKHRKASLGRRSAQAGHQTPFLRVIA
jgi:hypothetical protein